MVLNILLAYYLLHGIPAIRSYHNSNLNAALSMEAFNCNLGFLHPMIHDIRKQKGKYMQPEKFPNWFEGSDLSARDKKNQFRIRILSLCSTSTWSQL